MHRRRLRRRPALAVALAPRASLSPADGGASLGSLLTSGAVAVSFGAGLLALYNDSAPLGARRRGGRAPWPLPPPPSSSSSRQLKAPPQQQPRQRQLLPAASDDNLRWAVMGVVSCIPLFNWMVRGRPDLMCILLSFRRSLGARKGLSFFFSSFIGDDDDKTKPLRSLFPLPKKQKPTQNPRQAWLFGALDGGPRVYYLYAAMYALPLLQHGLGPGALSDPAALLLVAAGAAHCQLERVAATEPEERAALARRLSAPGLVRSAARAAAAALRAADGAEEGEGEGTERWGAPLPPQTPSAREREGGSGKSGGGSAGGGVARTLGAWLAAGEGGRGGRGVSDDEGDDGDPPDPLVEADRREARRVARMELEAFDRRLGASSASSSGDEGEEQKRQRGRAAGAEAEAEAAAAAERQQGQQARAPPYWQAPQPPPRRKQPAADDDLGGWGG